MRKSIKTTIFATAFFVGYAVGFLTYGAAVANESADTVHMDQVTGIKVTEYGIYLTFYDGTGYWWEYPSHQ